MIFMILDMMAKLPQIYTNFSNKSTGQMAFATFFLSFAGSGARMATVFFESDDPLFKLQFLSSFLLNFMIIVQFALYWNVAKKVDVSVTQPRKRDKNKLE